MEELLKSSILDELFEKRKIEFENFVKSKGEIKEEKRKIEDEEIFTKLIREKVKESDYKEILYRLNELETSIIIENNYWNKMFYKLGINDYEKLNNEMINHKFKNDFVNKKSTNEFFDKKIVEYISSIFEKEVDTLSEVEEFKKKDMQLMKEMENFEKELSSELREKWNNIIKLTYEIEDYYVTLSFSLGIKYFDKFNNFLL